MSKLRHFDPASWTWIFVALLLCLSIKAMQHKMNHGKMYPSQVASIFTLFSR
ncbi:MAG: hypothetical protein V4736_06320 [Bdellovibrionota bacterium]